MKAKKKAARRRTGSVTIDLRDMTSSGRLTDAMKKALSKAPTIIRDAIVAACERGAEQKEPEREELLIRWQDEWRMVLTYPPEQRFEIEDAAAMLSRAAGGLRLRIINVAKHEARDLTEHGTFRTSATYRP
jgi:hypothetical protein